MTPRKLAALRNLTERPGTEAEGKLAREILQRLPAPERTARSIPVCPDCGCPKWSDPCAECLLIRKVRSRAKRNQEIRSARSLLFLCICWAVCCAMLSVAWMDNTPIQIATSFGSGLFAVRAYEYRLRIRRLRGEK